MQSAKKVLILPGRPPGKARTHALDCRWAAGISNYVENQYVEVDAKDVPRGTPRCVHCGGGR